MTPLNHRLIALVLLIAACQLHSQPDQELDFKRPESWAMRYFAAAALMQGNGAPDELKAGQFALGFELSNIPHLSLSKRTVGFNGTKEENLNKSPVLARPLVHFGITDKLSITAAYVPPVEVFSRLRTHMAALSLQYRIYSSDRFAVAIRATGQWTEATGDFTADAETAGDPDPTRNPYGLAAPSDDTFTSLTASLEADFSYRLPTRRLSYLFFNTACTYSDLDFEVDAHYLSGFHDNRHLSTKGRIWSFGMGMRMQITPSISTSLSVVHAPLRVRRPPQFESENDALTNVRLVINLLL